MEGGEMKITELLLAELDRDGWYPQDSGTPAGTECTTGPARPRTTPHGSSLSFTREGPVRLHRSAVRARRGGLDAQDVGHTRQVRLCL